MSIRTKTLLIIAFIITVVFAAITFLTSRVLIDNANMMEQTRIEQNLDRAYQAYNVTLEATGTKLSDWSIWDDTFDFIQTGSRKFIDTNLGNTSLENLKIDVMLFMDNRGKVVFDKTHLHTTKQDATTSAALIKEITAISAEFVNDPSMREKKGLLLLPEGPIIFAVQPAVRSDGTGPSDGIVMFGEFFDDAMIQSLSHTTKLNIELYRLDQALTAHNAQMVSRLQGGKSVAVFILSAGETAAYRLLTDVNGKAILLLDVIMPREFYLQTLTSIKYVIGGFIAAGILFLSAILVILDKLVLIPLITLRREVADIGAGGETSNRVKTFSSGDEIAGLAADINKMLQSIEDSQAHIAEERTYAQAYMDMVGVLMVVLARDGSVQNINTKGCELLGYSREDLLHKNWFDLCLPEHNRGSVRKVFDQLMRGEIKGLETYENTILTRDGKEKIVEWHNAILRDAKGVTTGTVSVGQDITERAKSNEEMRTHASELERINQLMVGREIKMAELKKQVEELQQRLAAKEGA